MATDELHYLELTELTRRIHAGELTSAEATEASLARIAALDGTLHSFALVLPEYALEQARTADEQIRGGRIKGPLHGAPIAVKDLCWMQGVPTAAGLCYGSLGLDTGGSIRFPSAANGLAGLKPTWGRVSRHGVFELAATLDHTGPMTRSARRRRPRPRRRDPRGPLPRRHAG